MKQLKLITAAVVTLLGVTATHAAQFNFSYRFQGERSVYPLQVFDDGVNTYFQFRKDNKVVPAIVAESNGEAFVSNYSTYGPYVVVPGVASSYTLQYGTLTATITQTGGRQAVVVPTPPNPAAMSPAIAVASTAEMRPAVQRYVAYGAVNPVAGGPSPVVAAVDSRQGNLSDVVGAVSTNSTTYRIPFVMDKANMTPAAMKALTLALRAPGEIGAVQIVGRDDANYRDGIAAERAKNLATALIRYGVPESRISVKVGIPREDDKAGQPTSDVVITRVQARAAAIPAVAQRNEQPLPAGASAAVSMIRQGLSALVNLGAISQGRADAAMEVITQGMPRSMTSERSVDASVRPNLGAASQPLLARPAAGPSSAAMAPVQEVWTMTPADGMVSVGLAKWAKKAGWEFESRAGVDYPIKGPITVRGDAKTAIEYVEGLLKNKQRPLSHHMEGNKLVIEG